MRNHQSQLEQGENDFLDHILDGHPVHIVDSPDLRRRLERRSWQRAQTRFEELRNRLSDVRTTRSR